LTGSSKVARVIGLKVADTVVELQTPTADGPLQLHLRRYGDGIRSTVFGVKDLAQAQAHFAEHNLTPIPGGAPNTIAIPAEANLGLIFEFAE
jgi:hypothetical protein